MAYIQPPFAIQTTRGVSARQGVKMLVYSRSGVGKTTLIRTCPKPFILSSEKGLLSLANQDIPFAEMRSISDLRMAYQWFYARGDNENVQTVCLDSITDIADDVLKNELKQAADPRQAYGKLMSQILEIYKNFRDLPYRHVYFIAQQEPTKDEVTGAVMFGPSLPGQKLGVKVPYLFDETFQLIVDNQGTRWIRTRPDFRNEAKDRSGALAEYEPADLGAIIRKIMAHSA